MKKAIFILTFFCSVTLVWAQSRQETELLERTYLLSQTVFGTKDRAMAEDLFARKASYGHSSGKVETREQAIAAITGNTSVYRDTAVSNMSVISADDDVAIVRHQFKAAEHRADGTVTPLNLSIMLVWVKEKGRWRLMGRQAVKLS